MLDGEIEIKKMRERNDGYPVRTIKRNGWRRVIKVQCRDGEVDGVCFC
jgi:hypothetical protein